MSEELDNLKKLGAQKIYEDTHIPVNQVQAILYENFDGMSKVQFVGFISILEREYKTDLSGVKARGLAYFDEQKAHDDGEYAERIFSEPDAKNKKILLIALLGLIFVVLAFYLFTSTSSSSAPIAEENLTMQNSLVAEKKAETNSSVMLVEENSTQEAAPIALDDNTSEAAPATSVSEEQNLTVARVEEQKVQEQKAIPTSFKILPKKKVWLGYIDVKTNKKYQTIVKKELSLDPTKEWLLLFGHGYVSVVIDGKKYTYAKKDTLRLHYQDGVLSEISLREFKRLNKGRKW